jgi:hypothetical protein
MLINEIHDFIGFIISKEQTGYVSHEEIDNVLYRASVWLYNNRVPFYAVDQKAQDDLAPFKVKWTFTHGSSPAGLVTLPANYLHLLSVSTNTYDNVKEESVENGIEFVNDDEKSERLRSQLDPVTTTKPVAQWAGGKKIQLYPKKPSVGEIWYLKAPAKPKFDYTQVGRAITYVPSTSVHLEWDELNTNQVMYRALSYLGIRLDADKFIGYANQQNQVDA